MASIKERNGHYCVIYSYTNDKGKRKQKWETFNTKAEAKRRKLEIELDFQKGTFVLPTCTTVKELMKDYVALYGKEKWALSTYQGNVSLIKNYINPIIGDMKLSEVNTRFMESYYQQLLKTPAAANPMTGRPNNKLVSASTVRDAHKLLRNAFQQAVKWELMEKNPCINANTPKYKSKKRDIWTADVLIHALEVCEDERLKLAINLSFACSLRIGELLGLTWDCIDISDEAIEAGRPYLYINKESQRVSKDALKTLDTEVYHVDPENIAGFLESIRRVVAGIFHEAIGLAQYVYEECFVKGNSLEDIMPDDPRTQEAITAVYMLYMDEQNADESDEITS